MILDDAIQGGFNAIKGVADILKGIAALKTEAAVNMAVFEVQRLLLETQRALSAAESQHVADQRRIGQLEQDLLSMKHWNAEKERYQLVSIGAGAIAYAQKSGMENEQPAHWLCANCFDDGHRQVLLSQGSVYGETLFRCGRCKSVVRVSSHL